jgi:hypothetical protein
MEFCSHLERSDALRLDGSVFTGCAARDRPTLSCFHGGCASDSGIAHSNTADIAFANVAGDHR